jgi:glycosyltransferase involved in cell wall biosynthesis
MKKDWHCKKEDNLKFVCGVVVKVRDEEETIEESLLSLVNQTLKPFIVVVNDGSVDRTGEIASKYADTVVNLPSHEESWVGRPELARVVNSGLNVLKDKQLDFVMFSDGEALYPSNYIQEIARRMKDGFITLASGVAESEISRSFSPRGSGRLVDAYWFKTVGFKYPENYAFEAYLVYKALSEGRKVSVFPDLKFKLHRKTRIFPRKAYFWGKGMKALNYAFFYAVGRAFLYSLDSPRNGLALLQGYLSEVDKYHDIEQFVPAFQRKQLWNRVKEVLQV